MLSDEYRIKTKDPSILVLNGNLLQGREILCYQYGERNFVLTIWRKIRGKNQLFRDNSKLALTCYMHSQDYMNYLNKNLNYNFFLNSYSTFFKALDIFTFFVSLI